MNKLLPLLLLMACDPVTPRAAMRHEAYSKLSACLSYQELDVCLKESSEWCKSKGLENTCGADLLWDRYYDRKWFKK